MLFTKNSVPIPDQINLRKASTATLEPSSAWAQALSQQKWK